MTRPEMEFADYVRELTEHHTHAEHYQVKRGRTWYGANHVTKVPPLVTQLQHAVPTSADDNNSSRSGFRSQPAAWLESMDVLSQIDIAAHRWVIDLGGTPRGTSTIALLRQLHGLAASAHDVSRRELLRDIRKWWTQARILTGWQSPAWRPDNTCPMCSKRGGLRVRLIDQSALCVECGETWLPATIGLLAEHIRTENVEPSVGREA